MGPIRICISHNNWLEKRQGRLSGKAAGAERPAGASGAVKEPERGGLGRRTGVHCGTVQAPGEGAGTGKRAEKPVRVGWRK